MAFQKDRFAAGGVVFGFLLMSPLAWGSRAMTNLVDAAAAQACFAAYTNNVLLVEQVESGEWDPARRLDRLPFDMPFQLVVGPAAADRETAERALAVVTTSMPAHIRAYYARHLLMAPLLQWMIRRFKPGISNETQYVTAAAHPNVWRAADFDLARLSAAAENLTSNNVPLMAALVPVYEQFAFSPIRRAEPTVDYPDPRSEQTYATPFGAAVVLRARERQRKFRFAALGYPFRDRSVNFAWVVRGGGVSVGPMGGQWEKYPAKKGYADLALAWGVGRRDVLVFARYGEGPWGPPSVVSFYGIPNERRLYDAGGRILSVEYIAQRGVIPQLYQNKPWKDVFVWDSLGEIVGFQRTRTGEVWDVPFSVEGEKVLETYAGDRPKETSKVRYFTRQDDPETLDYEVQAETVTHPNVPVKPRDRGEYPQVKRKR